MRRDLDEGEYNASTSQKLVYMPDQLGSVRDVIDATTGSLVQSYDYTPYGATARTSGTTPTDYQYAGLFRHSPSNLNLSATRPQDGGTGRWLGRDLIREAGGINLYGYTYANPIRGFDSSGLLTAIIINGNGIGGHAGLFVSNGGDGHSLIYDPYGHYDPSSNVPITADPYTRDSLYPPRGSDGTIWSGDLWDYYRFQLGDGPDVQTYIFNTTPEEEAQIAKNAQELGESGFWTGFNSCGSKTSGALNGVGPFGTLGISSLPSTLGNQLRTIQQQQGTSGGISGGDIIQPPPLR